MVDYKEILGLSQQYYIQSAAADACDIVLPVPEDPTMLMQYEYACMWRNKCLIYNLIRKLFRNDC